VPQVTFWDWLFFFFFFTQSSLEMDVIASCDRAGSFLFFNQSHNPRCDGLVLFNRLGLEGGLGISGF
jgi:hypothetical protein